jgi:NAD(P)H-dependent FMN reductase
VNRVIVVSAIGSDESSCARLASVLGDLVSEAGAHAEVVRPSDAAQPGWPDRVAAADAHLWVSPELRPGMTDGPGDLYRNAPIQGHVVGLFAVASGATAAITTLDQLAEGAGALGATVAAKQCAFSAAELTQGLDGAGRDRARAVVAAVIEAVHTPGDIQP